MTKIAQYRVQLGAGLLPGDSFSLSYAAGDAAADLDTGAGTHLLIKEGPLGWSLFDDTDTWSVAFEDDSIVVTWAHSTIRIGDTDSLAILFGVGKVSVPGASLSDYKAVGDGVADDTLAVQAAFSAGGSLAVPVGRFRLTSPVTFPPMLQLVGAGKKASVFVGDHAGEVLAPEAYNVLNEGARFAHFGVAKEAGAYYRTGTGLRLGKMRNGMIDNVDTTGCEKGFVLKPEVHANYTYNNIFIGCSADNHAENALVLDCVASIFYDARSAAFTVGGTLTQTHPDGSTATAIITAVDTSGGSSTGTGTKGTLTLDTITGVFQNNELLVGSLGGGAMADGDLRGDFPNSTVVIGGDYRGGITTIDHIQGASCLFSGPDVQGSYLNLYHGHVGADGVRLSNMRLENSSADKYLDFDAKTVSFSVGEIVTGPTGSGTVVYIVGGTGSTGTLILSGIAGTLNDNDPLAGSLGGAAVANLAVYGNHIEGYGVIIEGANSQISGGSSSKVGLITRSDTSIIGHKHAGRFVFSRSPELYAAMRSNGASEWSNAGGMGICENFLTRSDNLTHADWVEDGSMNSSQNVINEWGYSDATEYDVRSTTPSSMQTTALPAAGKTVCLAYKLWSLGTPGYLQLRLEDQGSEAYSTTVWVDAVPRRHFFSATFGPNAVGFVKAGLKRGGGGYIKRWAATEASLNRGTSPGIYTRTTTAAAPWPIVNDAGFNIPSAWVAGAGWTVAGGLATRVAGAGTPTLSQTLPYTPVSGEAYTLTFNRTTDAGDFTISLGGGAASAAQSGNGPQEVTLVAGGTNQLVITASATFAGTLDDVDFIPARRFVIGTGRAGSNPPLVPLGGIVIPIKAGAFADTDRDNALNGDFSYNSTAGAFVMRTAANTTAKVSSRTADGTAGTGVTVVETGAGRNHTSKLTIATVLPAIAGGADLGVGVLAYTLPAGAMAIRYSRMALSITQTQAHINADTPDIGLGTVVASGAVALLSVNPLFENILTGQTATNCTGTASTKTVVGQPVAIESGDAHTVYINVADGWAASGDAAALLTGTVTIEWVDMT